jgi:hypothetical protein
MGTVEDRISALEQEVRELAQILRQGQVQSPRLESLKVFGAFADDPNFDEALRLGRAYRAKANLDKGSTGGAEE